MNNLKMQTKNLADGSFAALAAMFPNAVTETVDENGAVVRAIDADVLAQEINTHVVKGKEERYQFTWPDKKKSILLANAPIAATLRPCREESVNFDTTENLYIEGDNLDVLKLLRETYLNRVKMIYIDPPYNTGNDFVYPDDFAEDTDEFLVRDKQYDEEGNRMVRNLDSNGRFHTDWLNMMYPRLRIARDLLTEDGVIFISIDDNEQENIKKLCNEIMGESNYIAQFVVIRSEGGGLAKQAVIGHDYAIVYAKNINKFPALGRPKDIRGKIVNIDGEDYWIETDWLRKEFGKYGTCPYEEIEAWHSKTKKQEIDDGLKKGHYVLIECNGYHIVGRYRKVADDTSKFYTILKHLNKNGVDDLENLKLGGIFDYSKPISLIRELILGATIKGDKSDIILDFFSGSATTAHAVMQLNAEDGGKRKFIMVQLPEIIDENSEAFKAGYKNICEIGKERIRRAGKRVNAEFGERNAELRGNNSEFRTPNSAFTPHSELDIGFRVLKLDSTNMKDVYYTPQETADVDIAGLVDNIKSDRTPEDLLFQVMLDLGILLSSKVEKQKINGAEVFFVNDTYLVACFESVTNDIMTKIAQAKPSYAVFRDSGFASDSTLVNMEQIFKTYSPSTQRRVL